MDIDPVVDFSWFLGTLAYYHTRYGSLRSNPYASYSSTFTEPKWDLRRGRSELNSMTLNVAFFLPALSWHPASGFFKQSLAKSFRHLTSSFNACLRCSIESPRLPYLTRPHPHIGRGVTEGKCTIWSVSKSGSALHALTSSNVAERALPTGSSRVPVSAIWASCG